MKTFIEPYFVTRAPEFSFIDVADMVDGVLVGRYSRETLEEIQARYPGAEVMEYEEASKLHEAAQIAKYCKPLQVIDHDHYMYMLEVLPPVAWTRDSDGESFKLCERTTGNLTAIIVKYRGVYYEYTGDIRTPHKQVIEFVRAEIAAGRVTPLEGK
jgi:hypothetical protein